MGTNKTVNKTTSVFFIGMCPRGVSLLINLSSVFSYFVLLSCLRPLLCVDQGHSVGGSTKASFLLSVEPGRLICADYGETLKISCSVIANNILNKTVDSWSISLFSQGQGASLSNLRETTTLNNSIIKNCTFSVRVNWYNEKVFVCLAESSGAENDGQQILNESVVVRLNPRRANITGASFLETLRGKIVVVFWKPIEQSSVVYNYTLKYCLDDIEDDQLAHICPNYNILQSECQFRQSDYFGVTDTAGMICNASLSYGYTAPLYVPHVLNVISHRSGCQSQGSTCDFELAKFDEPSISLLVMIPHPVENVEILVTRRREVRLSWSYPPSLIGDREYSVDYNCSNKNTTRLGIISETYINLQSKSLNSYRPYALCRFCVKARLRRLGGSGVFSEPVCRETRLHEEIPSDAPKITCRGEDCATTSDDVARNVTVTWILPPPASWNGVLENVTVVYRRGNNRSKNMEVTETNTTKGATVLRGLEKNSSYIVAMAACNKEGCSRQGNGMAISAQPSTPAIRLAKESAGKPGYEVGLAVGGSVGVVLALFVLGLIIAAIVVKRKRKETRDPLPNLHPPEDYDNAEATTNQYANLEDKGQGQENVASDQESLNQNELGV